ncbi:MAG: NAD(P)H-quinone oxidoreductase subunit H 1 [Candidatus Sericytochromatia bacterium]|nr:MAG: NAD(P)H-quinone oxidoreductase subunit H 1 [Candidatus Sericytochromatia bacterium]
MTVEFKTEEMVINMGPHHPSTHGVLRLIVTLDGEIIKKVEPVIGYLHRSIERLAQDRNYFQYLPVVDRVDYISIIAAEWPLVLAVEKIGGIEVPERAEYIRVITAELTRIMSHLFYLGTFLLDLGATTVIMYALREREKIIDLMEELTGQRMMFNYFRYGGVNADVPEGWLSKVDEFCDYFVKMIDEYEILINKNPIFLSRVENIGIIPKEMIVEYGACGPIMRASGIKYDVRRDDPYSIYDRFDFDIPVGRKGDTLDRYLVRMQEMRESVKIIKQAVKQIPSGPCLKKKLAFSFKIPAGEAYCQVEAPRGNMGVYLISNGTNIPARVKYRTPSYANMQILPEVLKGTFLSDIMAIFGSFDVILPEVDR